MAYANTERNRRFVQNFQGLKYGERIVDGAARDMLNMTTELAPVAATRPGRYRVTYAGAGGAAAENMLPGAPVKAQVLDDRIYWATDTGIMMTGNKRLDLNVQITDMTPFGRKFVILPDVMIVDDALETVAFAGAKWKGRATLVPCDTDGLNKEIPVSGTAPQDPTPGDYWYDTGTGATRQYTVTGGWQATPFLTQVPSEPETGDIVYDSEEETFYRYADGSWSALSVNETEPEGPGAGDLWADGGELYVWETSGDWAAIPAGFTRLKPEVGGINAVSEDMAALYTSQLKDFKAGDTVFLEPENGEETTIGIYAVGDNGELLLDGLPAAGGGTYTVERRRPVLDFAVEHKNRLWGCRYGKNDRGEFVNEICASALGDPTNFFAFAGTAADSFTASIGVGGPWTGIADLGSSVLFFKEDSVFIVTGETPDEFSYEQLKVHGVQAGSERSMVQINGYLYYKSSHGIMRMTSTSYPVPISEDLGPDILHGGIAGTDGRRYYISMADEKEERCLYVYDTYYRTWTKESEPEGGILCFLRLHNELAAIGSAETQTEIKRQWAYDSERAEAEKPKLSDYESVLLYAAASLVWGIKCMYAEAIARTMPDKLCAIWQVDAAGMQAKLETASATVYIKEVKSVWHATKITFLRAALAPDGAALGTGYIPVGEDTMQALTTVVRKETDFPWMIETGVLGLDIPDFKRVREIGLRLIRQETTAVRFEISFDNGPFEEIAAVTGEAAGTIRLCPLPSHRNEWFRLRIRGTGDAVIYSIYYDLEDAGNYVH